MAKFALGCEPVVGSLTSSKKREYRVTNRLQEGKRPLYAVVFNFIDSRYFNVFATVGGNRQRGQRRLPRCRLCEANAYHGVRGVDLNLRLKASAFANTVTVYQCLEGGVIAVLQSYVDEDKDESFYTVSWACNIDGTPFVVAGGINGIIRVIDAGSEKIHKVLHNILGLHFLQWLTELIMVIILIEAVSYDLNSVSLNKRAWEWAYRLFIYSQISEKSGRWNSRGHGDSINEIRTQPLKPSLVVSASKDESVRLWNVHTGICILIFAGAGGHRNEVLSVDFHPSDIYRIASCGMDNTVKIWSMKEFWTYVEKSFTWTDLPSKFPTKYVQFPVFIASVHSNYVDCNRWLGDFILSKSVDNEIVLWEPKVKEQTPGEGVADILQKYPVPECDIWFIKFSCDFHYNAAAIGKRNREGKIFVWELQSSPPVLIARSVFGKVLKDPKSTIFSLFDTPLLLVTSGFVSKQSMANNPGELLSHAQSKSPIRQTAMSYDGSTILSCCEDGLIWRWDAVTAPPV
ncbi:polycomb group protein FERTILIZATION-INDEPENDENT ENDOSPERM [Senna tora]|uniref:Polycomb group protein FERTILIZATION-INDEPENDENT ENDOSPERM n=1 Tax=Senna tora TaxID=362788 RepID=A0A834WXA1_9FABA|nr:polycomb group protein FERTILIZATION-INDEPENDENT ENDOSPERM [Senna tora]